MEREKMCFYYRVATTGAIYHTNIGPYHKPDGTDPIENFIRICASHFNRIFRTSLHPYSEITVVEFSQVVKNTLFRKQRVENFTKICIVLSKNHLDFKFH